MPKNVLIASDHAGFALKAALIKALPDWQWVDLGPTDNSRVDYPDYAEKLSRQIAAGVAPQGILICGSGIGMSIAANKIDRIRAALVENPVGAKLAKLHNDANVLCLGARFIAIEYAAEITQAFLENDFVDQERHLARVKKITKLEDKT